VFVGALGANVKTAPSGFFQTLTVELSWSGDWKLSDAAVVQKDQNFAGRVKDGGPMSVGTDIGDGPIPALNAELVNAFFSDKSRQGWIEYANAKR
jgi:hypothetical protein